MLRALLHDTVAACSLRLGPGNVRGSQAGTFSSCESVKTPWSSVDKARKTKTLCEIFHWAGKHPIVADESEMVILKQQLDNKNTVDC